MKRRSAIGSPASSGSPGSTRPSTPLREEEPGGWCRGGKGGMGTVGGDEVARWDGGGGGGKEERIWVSVRLRPLNAKEGERNDASDWECINDTTIIFKNSVADRAMFPTAYSFDRVFDCESTSRQVYEEGAKEVALSVVSGINSSIFAYGQTSSGKTYTMTGITEYSVADIYDYIQKHKEREFVVKFSAMEIYNEAVRDLLSADSSPLRLLDDPERGTIVEKLTEETLRDESHLKELLAVCEAQRQIGETSLNEMSSRSHQILRLTIESSAREYLGRASSTTLAATVNFVDLAGSERASQALTAGTRLKEGCHINRSLLTLGTVIRKLSKGRNGHVPYRDSKLTRILQSALGGNARTAIICTMSPARSHIEQSRNTLLFATCAKEVATSAQVNVVMSEKALVKHLQRELARLESQLRYPGTDTSTEHSEVLLKEKDAQIKKMEKDIMELQQQRDLAQSRLEELLRVVGDDRASGQWEECSQSSVSHTRNLSEDGYSISETSDISSPKHSICSPMSSGLALDQRLESAQAGSEDSDHCKEVRCIEINELSTSRSDEFNLLLNEEIDSLLPLTDADKLVDPIPQPTGEMPFTPAVDQQLESVIKTVDNFVRAYPDGSSSQSLFRDISGSRVLVLTRSRSCRASLMTIADSSWFEDAEMSNKTPPNSFLKKFPGRPEGILRNPSSSTSSAENVELLVEGSQASEGLSSNDAVGTASQSSEQLSSGDVVITQETKTTSKKLSPDDAVRVRSQDIKTTSQSSEQLSTDDLSITQEIKTIAEKLSPDDAVNAQNIEATLEEDVSSSDLVSDLKEMDQLQYQKQFTSNQMQQTASEDSGVQKIVKDVCQDPMSNALESPSQWPLEFEKKQKEIIELWHECNVSLIHRTYFFVLFKGDPADSIYVEVEHRRLSFLKRTFTYGDLSMTATLESSNVSPASSLRNLRRERDMLYRQMLRKLSAEERVSLYTKWGIDLNSKQRKLQLAQCLWTKTDMEHVSESASLVAKLIGLLEPGQALKEMFGLTFSLQQTHRRSYSWIQGKSSFRAIAPY